MNINSLKWRQLRSLCLSVCSILPFSFFLFGSVNARCEPIRTAFFYGAPVPIDALSQYPRVVVESDNLPTPKPLLDKGVLVFAYLSVGEAEGWRAATRQLDDSWFLGKNTAWGSRIADLTRPAWGRFLIEQRMAGLWKKGYRGFFLDTLDSYQIVAKTPEAILAQEKALAEIILAMHKKFPGVKLLLNRGFTVLPRVAQVAAGVVAESLFQSWQPATATYVAVSEDDRKWLLAQLKEVNERYQLPITIIDYVDPTQIALARATAKRIEALGFSAWIATPPLNTLSVETAE